LLDLLAQLKEILRSDISPVHEAARAGDVRDSQAAIEAAQQALGYHVSVDFEAGLFKTVDWFGKQVGG
jgi:UDP-N-acetylglucosamine 4-epimerase